jgi:hypothetical protein
MHDTTAVSSTRALSGVEADAYIDKLAHIKHPTVRALVAAWRRGDMEEYEKLVHIALDEAFSSCGDGSVS